MNSYWDLYVAYVNKCVRNNWINDIDPHHYEMQWNHWLPKAVFPDLPLGQWLTLRQHAIASALQTLALREKCMCGWHKKHLPKALSELTLSYYREATRKLHAEKDELGRSVLGVKSAEKIHAKRDSLGRSLHSLSIHAEKDKLGRSVLGVKNAERINAEKDELGRSIQGVRNAERTNAEKDEWGRSINSVKGAEKANAEKDELGRSVNAVKGGEKANAEKDELGRSVNAMRSLHQVWESTVDGFRSNSGNVARHNKSLGWDPNARIRVG
jgi:hypothetical protein